jgi:CubicO group peptidase (beta-lactamase class C family)
MKRPSAVLAVLAAVVSSALSGANDSPENRARGFLDEVRASTSTPAVSGAVAVGGKMVFSGGAGLIDVEKRVPADGASVYNIGSVSKVVTAIAVMQLVESGRVRLDDDVRTYVPAFPDKGTRITIRNLLTHTSGIRHYRETDFPGTPDNENVEPIPDWEGGLKFFASDPLLFRPGTFFFYSSYAVNLLQGVVEKASGQSFLTYLRERVWGPAGMTRSGFDIPGEDFPGRAHSYRIVDGKPVPYWFNDLRYKFASGGMIASAEDLARLGAAMNHDLLVRPATRAIMFSDQDRGLRSFHPDKPATAIGFEQGMLWRLRRDSSGRRVVYECGSVKASNACLVDFVDEDLVAAIATNSWECCGWRKADALADIFRRPRGSRKPSK